MRSASEHPTFVETILVTTITGSHLNEKAARQLGSLFLQGRIVPTEVIHRNFLRES
jgi:hypothetical protein